MRRLSFVVCFLTFGGATACDAMARIEPGADVRTGQAAEPMDNRPPASYDLDETKLVADDIALNRRFGASVAIDGDDAVVGAPFDNVQGRRAGAAYVFHRCGGTWVQVAKLLASNGAADPIPESPPPPGNQFGTSVALSGDTLLVGAPGESVTGRASGAAYVFRRCGGVWTQESKLVPVDERRSDNFGTAVALRGDTAAIGSPRHGQTLVSPGAVYVFERREGAWTQEAELVPDVNHAQDFALFGSAVALADDTLLAGAPGAGDEELDPGAAYVFRRSGDTWTQEARLVAEHGTANDGFGSAVALARRTALIGAPRADLDAPLSGAAYVFRRSHDGWTQEESLSAPHGEPGFDFGMSVALARGTLVVGATRLDTQGAAYVFRRTRAETCAIAELVASDGAPGDELGASVALGEGTAMVGAPNAPGPAFVAGAVYVFSPMDEGDEGDDP